MSAPARPRRPIIIDSQMLASMIQRDTATVRYLVQRKLIEPCGQAPRRGRSGRGLLLFDLYDVQHRLTGTRWWPA